MRRTGRGAVRGAMLAARGICGTCASEREVVYERSALVYGEGERVPPVGKEKPQLCEQLAECAGRLDPLHSLAAALEKGIRTAPEGSDLSSEKSTSELYSRIYQRTSTAESTNVNLTKMKLRT